MVLHTAGRRGWHPRRLPSCNENVAARRMLGGMQTDEVVLPTVHLAKHIGKDAGRRAERDHLRRVRPGAYVWVPADLTGWQEERFLAFARCVAYGAQLRADLTFSHESAALLHGLPLWSYGNKTFVHQPYGWSGEGDPDLVRRSGHLADTDRETVQGLPVTSLERTVTDCARVLHPRDALVVTDAALRRLAQVKRNDRDGSLDRMADVRALLLERLEALGPARGVVQARAVVAAANGLAESPGETVQRWIAVSHGLPEPDLQVPVRTRLGLFYLDGAWHGDGWKLGLEHDGAVKYGGDGADAAVVVEQEKEREDAIREEGYPIMRTVAKDLVRVRETFARMCARLPAALVEQARPVPGLYLPPSYQR
ncbi:hypothetical protein [Georgenia sp. H159]|uniref:hypothetical protein n=1 Tax=Georgenia sp. H159 TaxID=3076115 RepID=UPI002D799498|nr:hypothetical protein [Georgenia sp. H159]